MIIENGTIEFKQKTSGTIDKVTGYPSKSTDAGWSEPIPCQYIPVNRTLLTTTASGERITTATYKLLVEMAPLPQSEQLRLNDRSSKCLGEFSLLAPPEPLDAVSQIVMYI